MSSNATTGASEEALASLLRTSPPGFRVHDFGGGVVDIAFPSQNRAHIVVFLVVVALTWSGGCVSKGEWSLLGLFLGVVALVGYELVAARFVVRLRPDRVEVVRHGGFLRSTKSARRDAVRAVLQVEADHSGPHPPWYLQVEADTTLNFEAMPEDIANWLGGVVSAWAGRPYLPVGAAPPPAPPVDPRDPRLLVTQGGALLLSVGVGALLGVAAAEPGMTGQFAGMGAFFGFLAGSLIAFMIPGIGRRRR